ncbi:mannitol 2-dehydrogenase [Spirosoma lacussanchae]|uniref:hypothetical protein n=1 Tax=Spirosoma lacussanchae TaxID=1884249 RepID=UPI0011082E04|nr:hypothetical protein [Spirosoma lacussanchae]
MLTRIDQLLTADRTGANLPGYSPAAHGADQWTETVGVTDQSMRVAAFTWLAYPLVLAEPTADIGSGGLYHSYLRSFVVHFDAATHKVVSETEQSAWVDQLLNQFAETVDTDSLHRLCAEGVSVLPAFLLPVLTQELNQGHTMAGLAFWLAAYGHYLHTVSTAVQSGVSPYRLQLNEEDVLRATSSDVTALFDIQPLESARLRLFPALVAQYKTYRTQIALHGLVFPLKQTLCAFWEEQPNEVTVLTSA